MKTQTQSKASAGDSSTPEVTPAPNMTVAFDKKQVEQFQSSIPVLLEQVKECAVQDEADYEISAALLQQLKAKKEKLKAIFDKPVQDAYNVHRFLTTLRSGPMKILEQAEEMLLKRRTAYRADQERQRQAREAEERKKAKEEADQRAVEEAKKLAEIGETQAADIIIDRQAIAPPPPVIVPSSVPKQEGHSIRKVWRFKIKDPNLIRREFLGPVAEKAFDPSEYPKIRALVEKMGPDAAAMICGIDVYPDEIESVRTRR